VIGAGRLGLGVLAPLAADLKMSSLLVVAGENTSRDMVKRYTDGRYSVTLDTPPSQKEVTGYQFATRSEVDTIVRSIADLDTRVVSTSVGEDRLPEVLPIIVAGLRERARLGGAKAPATGLVILVCENGRGPDGGPRAGSVRAQLKETLETGDFDSLAELPTIVLDSIVPHPPGEDLNMKVSRGDIWIEQTDLTRELFGASANVHLTNRSTISQIHTRKLYCVNTLHLLLSVSGALVGEERLERIATDPTLEPHWLEICDSLAAAAAGPNAALRDFEVGGTPTVEYAKAALKRLQQPPWPGFDNVERAMEKLRRGWYLDDGRIDGPVVDAGLVEAPHEHPALVHAIALALHSVVGSINALAQRFAFVPSDPPAPPYRQNAKYAFASGLALAAQSPFTGDKERTPLVEALARDFQRLNTVRRRPWTSSMLAEFLDQGISTELRALPRRAGQIQCVMFDLDEGMVATESLLYRVTRELIAEWSHDGSTLTHDEYAKYVGSPEPEFFKMMATAFQIESSPKQLVREREERFVKALGEVNSELLLKPGFRALLAFLSERGITMTVCSNATERRVTKTLERAGINNYFRRVITPSPEVQPKGSNSGPSMYESVLDELNQKPENCVVVESSLFGVEAAVEAGLYTLLVVNDYTEPRRAARAGVRVLGNAQMLQKWFEEHWDNLPARS
jgi:HAD superfamily hydrolase (TIGR01509 family)